MQFKKGAEVFSGEGAKIGTLNRLILDPRTREVSDLIVEKGFLFKTDKVIPITLVDLDVEDRIVLKKTNQDIEEDFPDFETTYYVPLDEPDNPYQQDIEASSLYPPVHPELRLGDHLRHPVPEFVAKTTLVPAVWITSVAEDEIHLSVESALFERLPDYQRTE